jgi:uncharacterized protein YoxC
MKEPLFWLGLSICLVAMSLTAVLLVALPALQELGRAARSAEKLFDTLRQEFPPTLEAIRLTGLEISELTDDINDGVKSASDVVKQVDQSITSTKQQVQKVGKGTRQVVAGVKAAWQTWQTPSNPSPSKKQERLKPSAQESLGYSAHQQDLMSSSSSHWQNEVSDQDQDSEILNS